MYIAKFEKMKSERQKREGTNLVTQKIDITDGHGFGNRGTCPVPSVNARMDFFVFHPGGLLRQFRL